jgi:hypothetical protein
MKHVALFVPTSANFNGSMQKFCTMPSRTSNGTLHGFQRSQLRYTIISSEKLNTPCQAAEEDAAFLTVPRVSRRLVEPVPHLGQQTLNARDKVQRTFQIKSRRRRTASILVLDF